MDIKGFNRQASRKDQGFLAFDAHKNGKHRRSAAERRHWTAAGMSSFQGSSTRQEMIHFVNIALHMSELREAELPPDQPRHGWINLILFFFLETYPTRTGRCCQS